MFNILKNIDKRIGFLAILSTAFIICQVWLELKIPEYMSQITTIVNSGIDNVNGILVTGAYMLLCALGSLLSSITVGFIVSRIGSHLAMTIRSKMYNKTMAFAKSEIAQFSISSLITRSTNDITQVQMFFTMLLQVIIKAPIMGLWAISKIFGKSWEWTTATGVALVFVLMLFIVIISLTVPKFAIVQKLIDRVSRIARENITGIRVIRAYQAQSYHEEKFQKANEHLTKVNKFTGRTMGFMDPSMTLIMSYLSLSIYWIGAYLINNAGMGDKFTLFSDMVVFSSYSTQVIMSFMMMTVTFIIFPRAKVSANRINEVLKTPISVVEGSVNDSPEVKSGTLEFNNVCFKYPDAEEYVIKNINFSAKKGETIAFIGSTGSGKSTIINLIPRLYDATEGEILLDGVNVKDYTFDALYNKIGYVPQQAMLFSGTVFSNVAFGKNKNEQTTEQDVIKALTIAQAIDFVNELEGGLNAEIARGGTNVSGGQRQRLSIARAICRGAEFLIFDDSFSALDFKTDFNLRNALRNETQGVTKLIVAQRIGTIMDADQILVIDDGEIVGKGTHKELIKSCPVYIEIAESQLSKEEIYGE